MLETHRHRGRSDRPASPLPLRRRPLPPSRATGRRRSATLPLLLGFLLAIPLVALAPPPSEAASLRPSRPALMRQVRAAQAHGAYYAANEADLRTMRRTGELVRIEGDRNHVLKGTVPYPYARPEVKLFLERLGAQYRSSCGKRLVVTSLVRPKNRQPRNSSAFSVHPTGMAMDLRVSSSRRCRSWLEQVLLSLEGRGLLEAARERYPPHYHVVLFPDPYLEYVEAREGEAAVADYRPRGELVAGEVVDYRVRRGDSLWKIARRYDTTIGSIRSVNALPSSSIRPGQVLRVPVGMEATLAAYTVRRGDTLSGIAARFGTSAFAIQQVNGLASTRIRVGQRLNVPRGELTADGVPGARLATYRVRSGDSLWEIARRHGTSPGAIQRVNDLPSSRIRPGQVLRIPTR